MSRIDIVGFARQGAGMGTKVTVMEHFPPAQSLDVTEQQEQITVEETTGDPFPTGLDYGTRYFELALAMAPRMASAPRVKSAFLGQPTTVAGAAGDAGSFEHTFDPAVAGKAPEPHSIFAVNEDPNPAIVGLYWDAKGNTFEETYAPNAANVGTYNLIALDLDTEQAAPVPSPDGSSRRNFKDVTVYIDLDGAGELAIPCAAASFNYDNGLDVDEAVLGSRKLYALPVGNRNAGFKFSPREALRTYWLERLKDDPTTSSARIVAKGPSIGATTKFFQVETIIPAFEITDAPASVSGSDTLKMIEVTGRCKKDIATGKFISQVYTNDVATY